MAGAIFLDRDGTLNVDKGYAHAIADWQWLPEALAGLQLLQKAGWPLVVVSNQSGIARGFFTLADLEKLEKFVNSELAQNNVRIRKWYYCPHGPESDCCCRKPRPGLLQKAASELNLDLAESWMIGDRLRDIHAGQAAGCRNILLNNEAYPVEKGEAQKMGIPVVANLLQAAEVVAGSKGNQSGL